MSEPVVPMPECPGCGEPAIMLMPGGRQAFCGTTTGEGCRVITWDPTADPERLWAEVNEIDVFFADGR